jgi:ATP-binding cassette subfamily F protein uup
VLDQEPVLPGATVGEAAAAALGWHHEAKRGWQAALDAGDTATAARLQDLLDLHGWDLDHRVIALLDRVHAPPRETPLRGLSGGELRRVALVHALLASPDLLLLDEPTNHLDADTVEWLEDHLANFPGGVVLVTHDRYLLERVATGIVEIEDGQTVQWPDMSYADYLIARAERQAALHREHDARLAMIAHEAEWASRSPAARTTKQRARLDRLEALKALRPLKREETFTLDLRTKEKLGRTLVEARGLRKRLGDRTLFDHVDVDLGPGTRLGIVGPNGAGKSTLLRLLTGDLAPDAGTVRRAPRIKVAVLDQHRTGLDPKNTVFEAAGDGNTWVTVGDEPVHVAGFLQRFLFTRESFDQSVAGLSGGERARLLLARMLLQGAHVLMLDEPTNDLDLMTLAVLEEALLAFDGAVFVITHDRAFLDRVCTGLLAFDGEGHVVAYASRQQWDEARARARKEAAAPAPAPVVAAAPKARTRLSYKEQQELDALPKRIEALETEQAALEATLADPASYRSRAAEVPALNARLAALATELEALWERWAALSERA